MGLLSIIPAMTLFTFLLGLVPLNPMYDIMCDIMYDMMYDLIL